MLRGTPAIVAIVVANVLALVLVFELAMRQVAKGAEGKSLRAGMRRVLLRPWDRYRYPRVGAPLTTVVEVAPLGDGRPGERFLAPAPPKHVRTGVAADGSCQDAVVPLSPGAFLLVACAGRVGSVHDGHEILPARERVYAAVASMAEGRLLGDVHVFPAPFGTGYRVTYRYESHLRLTDIHVDHDGWGFIVGLLGAGDDPAAVGVLGNVLATWRWLPAQVDSQA